MSRRIRSSSLCRLLTVVAATFLTSCGDSAPRFNPPPVAIDTTVATVDVDISAMLFTKTGESRSILATAYNAAGEAIDADFMWEVTNPSVFQVEEGMDGAAAVISRVSAGSARISVRAGGQVSKPIYAVAALPASNAIPVSDSQVASPIQAVDPAADWGLGYRYTISLVDLAPVPGDVLIGTGETPLAGRVVDVVPSGDVFVATLEIVPISALFTELVIEDRVPIFASPEHISDKAAEYYTASLDSDGSLLFTSKNQQSSAQQTTGKAENGGVTFSPGDSLSLGPFDCSLNDLVPTNGMISLPSVMPSVSLQNNLGLIFDYNSSTGYFKLAVDGTAKAEFKIAPTLNVQLESKFTCKAELVEIPIPTIPALQLIFGAQLPIGIGFEIGGKLPITGVGAEIKTNVTAEAELGLECPVAADCAVLDTLDWKGDADYKLIIPDGDLVDGLKIEPSAGGFVFAGIDVGNPIFDELQWGVLEVKAGLFQNASLASPKGQVTDIEYSSDYKLSIGLTAGLAEDALVPINFLKDIDLISSAVNQVAFTYTQPLYESPAATTIESDVATFSIGDTVNFDLTLDPEKLDYMLLPTPQGNLTIDYNVDEILLYRKNDFGGDFELLEIARTDADDGQTEFSLSWQADASGNVADSFYAFATTRAWPLPVFDELELGPVKAPVPEGRIVYWSWGNYSESGPTSFDVYSMNADGSGSEVIADRGVAVGVSPGGQKIAVSYQDPDTNIQDLYLMNPDGSNWVNLTNHTENGDYQSGYVEFSPDGTKVYYSYVEDGFWQGTDVFVVNADGSNKRNLTNSSGVNGVYDRLHDISSDGSKLLIVSNRNGNNDVFIVDSDGSNAFTLGATGAEENAPAFSPDNQRVTFTSTREGVWNIYVADIDGNDVTNLTADLAYNAISSGTGARFTHDGAHVIFFNNMGSGLTALFGIAVDTLDVTPLTGDVRRAHNGHFDVSPQGKIVFSMQGAGSLNDIFVVDVNGQNLQNLTNSADREDQNALWID